jgi:hypothetical protein
MSEIKTEYYNNESPVLEIKNKWWGVDPKSAFQHTFGVVQAIETNQNYRQIQNLKYARLYSNMELLGFYGTLFSRTANSPVMSNRVTLNVIKACVDTAASKISKNKPRPMFLTSGGNFKQQRRAKQLTKYMDGAFEAANLYNIAQLIFTDAGVMGTGAIKFYKDEANARICAERVLIDEIIVDDAEGMYGHPRQLHQRKYIHREVLLDMFPKHKNMIMAATGGVKGENSSTTAADLIKVIESWHLPSGKDAGDGKHLICIENCTLFSEDYKKSYFPFVFYRWSPRLVGFFGAGLAEELIGIQVEINKLLRTIQLAQHQMAVPRVFVENSSMVNTSHLTNEISGIVKYTGTAPIFGVAPSMSPEVYAHLENLYRKAFEITGVSQMSATSKKPSGLNSGAALREYSDIESERFIVAGQRWEQMFMEAAEIIVDLSRDMFTDNKNLKVKVKGSKFLETIKWSEVDMEDDQFVMRVFPTSILPSTPSGKLAMIQELMTSGFIEKAQAMSLLDFPDLQSFMNLQNAAIDDINMLLEKMIENGEYNSPEPYMNLKLAINMTQSAYLRAKTESVPEERLELLRTFMDDCNDILASAEQPSMPPPPEAVATGVPAAPPIGELLPTVPVV